MTDWREDAEVPSSEESPELAAQQPPEPQPNPVEVILITGLAGAGRSEAIHTFEDLGYFCIDNLPPAFLGQVVELARLPESRIERVAVVCDMRGMAFFGQLMGALDRLHQQGQQVHILFLEAADRVLVNRFKTTRRRHPLAETGTIMGGVRAERVGMAKVRDRADMIIDTSDMTPQQLRETIRRQFLSLNLRDTLSVTIQSFGFKYGLPIDADIVMDVRFLPNPYYMPRLRHRTGLENAVRKFVLGRLETQVFIERWFPLLEELLPNYLLEGKHHLSVAMGCTGGMHRSVVLAEETKKHLDQLGYDVTVNHRDIRKDRDHQ
jgi:RNase adapter protein RapZ